MDGRRMSGNKPLYVVIKRAFDVVFSACAVIVLFIPAAVLAVAIFIESPGAPIFCQWRVGRWGKEIRIFKFRSMYRDASWAPEKYLTKEQLAEWRRERKIEDDPRITTIGRFIRRTSIDELPQFINVLLGDMSVVGPRPVTLSETYEYGSAREEILAVKPGITGLWQVSARNEATWESGERQKLELDYVRNRSIGLDVRIMLGTVWAIFKETGR